MPLDTTARAALDAALAKTGLRLEPEALRDLLAGIAAAPVGGDPDAWLAIVLPEATPEQKAALTAARDAVAADRRPAGPPPRERLGALREELKRRGLDAFVVPHSDEHQGEYLPARAERLAWLTGFTGSAGVAIVTADHAALFVDGRYTTQAAEQIDRAAWDQKHLMEDPHEAWLAEALPKGGVAGYDPRLHTQPWVEKTRRSVEAAGARLEPAADNPIDGLWRDQPPPPLSPVVAHDLAYAGKPAAEKRAELGLALAKDRGGAAVLSAPESIAWLLNIRGGDVPHTPLPLSFAVLHDTGLVDLYIDRRKLTPGLERHLGNGVMVEPPGALGPALDALGRAGKTVLVDAQSGGAWLHDRLTAAGAKVRVGSDPCVLPRARKNPVELAGMRSAHRRDAAAMARFLAWLAEEAPRGNLDELAAAERLHRFRAAGDLYRDDSFEAISGAGPNAALPHYRTAPETNRRLEPGSVYLIDSGAQYLDGTTDITRTVAIGTPTDEMRRRATLVLKGHIAIATARFPKGTTGSQIDVLARQALWRDGLDYDHGTGHGVGSYLSVHEGPARISKVGNTVALEPGMILSNEPGYYKPGAYGIRIENLVVVKPCDDIPGAERPMLDFETLTFAPIDLALVEPSLLTAEERSWLDAYHARVRAMVSPQLDAATAAWLEQATRLLG